MNGSQLIQILISSAAGLFGVGVGVGLFRGSVKQMQKDLERVQYKQIRLRGEDNGGIPLYVTKKSCDILRSTYNLVHSEKAQNINENLKEHTLSIKSLNNFARWWMQKEGLSIDEINRILNNVRE